ncbi:hypothetical protein KCU91_g1750, partial [Aureobasidium melanogenum]
MAQWPKQTLKYPDDDSQSDAYIKGPDPDIIIGSTENQGFNSIHQLGSSAGDHVLYPGSQYADAQGKYRLRMDVSYQGYGYHINQPTEVLAISVLVAFCL